jgi:hypothetical protein
MHREVRDKTDELSDLCCKLLKLKVKTEEINDLGRKLFLFKLRNAAFIARNIYATIGMFVRDDTREKQDK